MNWAIGSSKSTSYYRTIAFEPTFLIGFRYGLLSEADGLLFFGPLTKVTERTIG
jgi:hypothetical protein